MTDPHAPGPSHPPGFRLAARLRLRRTADFERAIHDGVRLLDERMTLWALPNGTAQTRFGMMVGRRHGGAVRRNRIKRLLREAFRLTRPGLPTGLDLVCAPRAGTAATLAGFQESLQRLAGRAARRLLRP